MQNAPLGQGWSSQSCTHCEQHCAMAWVPASALAELCRAAAS